MNELKYEYLEKAFSDSELFGKAFGVWKLEPDKDGKDTKIPYSVHTGQRANKEDQKNGVSIDEAIQFYEANKDKYDGIALFPTPDIYFIDLDKVLGNKDYTTLVSDFLENTNGTYAEISQSKTGLHIIGKGKKTASRCKRKPVEIYDYDNNRFCALTGNVIGDRYEIKEIPQDKSEYLENKYLGSTNKGNADVSNIVINEQPKTDESEDEIIERLSKIKTFKTLFYTGDYESITTKKNEQRFPTHSEADFFLIELLIKATNEDYKKVKNIFNRSALLREKTHSKRGEDSTYFKDTYSEALARYREKQEKIANAINVDEFPMSDKGNADRFLKYSKHADSMIFVEDQNSWFTYQNGVWKDKGRKAEQYMAEFQEETAERKFYSSKSTEKEQEQSVSDWGKHKKKITNRKAIENALWFVKNEKNTTLEAFDQDDFLLNCKNGVLDLKTFDLLPHDPKKLMTKQIATVYDSEADCPKWKKFIREIFSDDQEIIKFVQRAIGYSLTGSTREQVMFLLIGKGSNGKGVFTGTIQELLGGDKNYATTVQADSLLKSKKSGGHSDDKASMRGARFVVSSEPNENEAMNEGFIKQFTGGDMVSASHKGGRTFSYKPKGKIWLSTNHFPYIAGTDEGIWRRLIIIPFIRQFLDNEKDPLLQEKLKSELPGILNWCLAGLKDYYNRGGLDVPESLEAYKKSVRRDYNPIERFILERCEFTEKVTTQQKELLQEYNAWAIANGEKTLSSKAFGSKIRNIENVLYEKMPNGKTFYNVHIKR